jgi:hypothetical protein
MTLGAINPRKKGLSTMAKRRKKTGRKNPHRSYTHSKTSHRRKSYRRRNPMALASGTGVAMAKSVVGGLIGLTLTRMAAAAITGMIPGASTGLMRAVVSIAAAFGVGKLVGSVDRDFGAAAAFGGYMQAGSDTLNVVAPSLAGTIGLRGLGAWMPSRFAVPEDPIMRGMAIAAPAPTSGVGAFRRGAF